MINPTPFLRELFEAAVEAADPMRTIPKALPTKPKGRVVVIGAGNARGWLLPDMGMSGPVRG